MIINLGGLNIYTTNDIIYLKNTIESWWNQTIPTKLYLSLYIKSKDHTNLDFLYKEMYKQNLNIYYQENELTLIEHLREIYKSYTFNDDTWFIFTEMGIWHPSRIEVFKQCIDNINKFNSKVDYIRIARTIFSNKKMVDYNIDNINKIMKDGDIISNESDIWGHITEYAINKEIINIFFNRTDIYDDIWKRINCDRYFLKYINCNKYKFIKLNTETLSIFYWMYFNILNTPHEYFKNIRTLDLYENEFCLLSQNDILPTTNYLLKIDSDIITPIGPGKIIDIIPNQKKKYKVIVNWDETDTNKEYLYNLSEIYKFDNNKSRKHLYSFITNLINNIELYLCNHIFLKKDNYLPNNEHFNNIIKMYLEKNKQKKSDNMLEKLGQILDDKNKNIKETIYENNLSKQIFEFIIQNKVYKKIIFIEKSNNN